MTCIGLVLLILGASPYSVWQRVYNWGDSDRAYGSVLTYADSLIVSGESDSQGDFDCVLLNLSRQGDTLWTIFYDDDHGDESGRDVDVDSAGNIYVACASDWDDWPSGGSGDILKYSPSCELIWRRGSYGNLSERVIVGYENHIFLGVRYQGPVGVGVRIVAYDTLGSVLWREFFQPPEDVRPTGVALSSNNSIWVSALWPCTLVGWESDGTPTFYVIYEEDSARGQAIGIDQGDNVFIAGELSIDSQRDFMLLKYLLNGLPVWPDAKVYDLGHNEYCRDFALDSISDCYLAGWQARGDEDVALIKTDSAGNMLWAWVDTVEGKQEIEAIEVDEDGYIYLAGSHYNGTDWDMLVMKVAQPLTISGRVTDSTGKAMKDIAVALTGDTTVEVLTDDEGYYSIEVYNGGEYTLSPKLPGWAFEPSSRTYSPLAHREWDQDFADGRWTGIAEPSLPLEFDLQVEGNRILYQVPCATHVKIGVYDVSGRFVYEVVDGELESGNHSFDLKGSSRTVASGVYFVKMTTDEYKKTQKMVILE